MKKLWIPMALCLLVFGATLLSGCAKITWLMEGDYNVTSIENLYGANFDINTNATEEFSVEVVVDKKIKIKYLKISEKGDGTYKASSNTINEKYDIKKSGKLVFVNPDEVEFDKVFVIKVKSDDKVTMTYRHYINGTYVDMYKVTFERASA